MKKRTIGILILVVVVIGAAAIAFTSSKKASFKPSPADTSNTVLMYISKKGGLHLDFGIRITHDTLLSEKADSSGGKVTEVKTMKRDSLYFIPSMDTVFDANKKPVLDSLGRVRVEVTYVPIHRDFVSEITIPVLNKKKQ